MILSESKICQKCRKDVLLNEYYKREASPDGKQAICIKCAKKHCRQYYGFSHTGVENPPPPDLENEIDTRWNHADPFYQLKSMPKDRTVCVKASRPCPFIGCKNHMATALHKLDIKNKTDKDWDNFIFLIPETCIEDVTEKCGVTLEYIGACLGLSRERVRQIEHHEKRGTGAIEKMRHPIRARELILYWEGGEYEKSIS